MRGFQGAGSVFLGNVLKRKSEPESMKVEHSAVFILYPLLLECSDRKKKEYRSIANCMLLLKTERGGSQNHSELKRKKLEQINKRYLERKFCHEYNTTEWIFFCIKRNVFVEVSSPSAIYIKIALMFHCFCNI